MGRTGKLPFSPWGDRNADLECTKPTCAEHDPDGTPDAVLDECPDCQAHRDGTSTAECDHDARYKWGHAGHYVTGEDVAKGEVHPDVDGRVFIQRESDPFAFVDGDDVRDPETGEVHPAFTAILEHLGLTYADVSTSGAGVHAYYEGELPIEGKGQAAFEIDTEPWGANDSPPTVEIYANKHVCVTTGAHVPNTPIEASEWDADALRAILEANGYTDQPEIAHDTDHDRADLEDYDPGTTTADETATDVRDVLTAIDRLSVRDLPLRSRQTGTDSTGWETWSPSYRTSESGESVHRPSDEPVFYDHKEGESFGLLGLFAAEQGIISKPWSRLSGGDWWDAVEAARDAGAPIPEYDPAPDAEYTPTLPPAVRDLSTATSGWDWRHAAGADPDLSIDAARQRTTDAIADAYERGDRVLIEALPTMGKSYGAVAAAAETGQPVTILTGRGRKEQYDQFKDWCADHGLTYKELPSFTHDCPTAAGEHGDEWAETVGDWYRRGATPKAIHKFAEDVLGRPLPCQVDKGGNHVECPYAAKWRFDPDDYEDTGEPWDVLIGHYTHAYKEKVTQGRTVVFDEFPGGSYETQLSAQLQGAVSYWLSTEDAVPFDDYTDLIENRDDDARRADALAWFLNDDGEMDADTDERHVLDDDAAHASAPLAVFAILTGDDLGNEFESASLDGAGSVAFDRAQGQVSILSPPSLEYASGVVALDGTPTKRMWELTLGGRLNHREVLQPGERAEYVRDVLNLNLVRTTDAVKPYNSGDHVNVEQDAALLERVADEHGERPGVITTMTALDEYTNADVLDYDPESGDVTDGLASAVKWYGDVLGSNEFKEKRLGAVIGSNHYGDRFIKKWGAYAGHAVERNDEKGDGLSYGRFGDRIHAHMSKHDTLQAAMRFGRDGNGAVVYVHTDTLPEWVPLAGEGRVLTTWSDGMRDVVEALEDLGGATAAEIAAHPSVGVGERQVLNNLESLRDRGALSRDRDPEDGRRFVWRDDGLHELGEHGDVELDPVELADLSEGEVTEVARSSIYTWDFVHSPSTTASHTTNSAGDESTGGDPAAHGTDPPPTGD